MHVCTHVIQHPFIHLAIEIVVSAAGTSRAFDANDDDIDDHNDDCSFIVSSRPAHDLTNF